MTATTFTEARDHARAALLAELQAANPGRRFAVSRDGYGIAVWSDRARDWLIQYAYAFVGRWVYLGGRSIHTYSPSAWIEQPAH